MCVRIVLEMTLLLLPLSNWSETKTHPWSTWEHFRVSFIYIVFLLLLLFFLSPKHQQIIYLSLFSGSYPPCFWTCFGCIFTDQCLLHHLSPNSKVKIYEMCWCVWGYSMQTFKLPWLINLSAHLGQLTKTSEQGTRM